MKKTLIFVALLSAALGVSAQNKCNNAAKECNNPAVRTELMRGIGPAIDVNNNPQYGSNIRVLPENAQTFINTLFPNVATASVEKNLKLNAYEVKMDNGYEVLFDYAGNWLEVEAPNNTMLSSEIIKQLVPQNEVVATLSGDTVVPGGVINYVEEIDYIPGFGYVVEYADVLNGGGKIAVDTNGNVQSMKAVKEMAKKAKDGMRGDRKGGKKAYAKSQKKAKKGARKVNASASATCNN